MTEKSRVGRCSAIPRYISLCLLASLSTAALAWPASNQANKSFLGKTEIAIEKFAIRRLALQRAAELAEAVRLGGLSSIAPAAKKSTFLSDDLITATGEVDAVIRARLGNQRGSMVRQVPIDEFIVPRGVDYCADKNIVAIAAISKVVLYDAGTGEVTTVERPSRRESFRFATDVVCDQKGSVIIVDFGEAFNRTPRDGRIWRLNLETGKIERIRGGRRWTNPGLVDIEPNGDLLVVDGDAGPEILPGSGSFFDTVHRLKAPAFKKSTPVFTGRGLIATAFTVHPDGRLWFGTVWNLTILDNGRLIEPCPRFGRVFAFANAMDVNSSQEVLVVDGSSTTSAPTAIRQVDENCRVTRRAQGSKLSGAKGLGIVP